MDVGSPERFEIELEEQPAKRSRLRRGRPEPLPSPVAFQPPPAGDAVFTPAAAPEQPTGSPERNRLIVTALAVGVVALFLGWSLGRAGGDGDEAAQTGGTTATTTVASTTPDDESQPIPDREETGDTLPEAELPTTTRPRPTSTTTLPPAWVESQVTLDPRLAGQADRLVAVDADGSLIELDLRSSSVRTLERGRPSGNSPLPPVAGDGWIVIAFDDGRAPQLFSDGATESVPLDAVDPWSIMWDTASGTYWERTWDVRGSQINDLVEHSVDGGATGRTIDTRGLWAMQPDFTGAVIIGDGSIGAYRVTPDGSERLADGYVVSVGVGHLVVYACAENFDSCGMSVVDRASGESRPVPVTDEVAMQLVSTGGWWGLPSTPEVNVAGTGALVSLPDDNGMPQVGVLDLVTGELTTFGPGSSGFSQSFAYPSGAWSADGRFAYLVDDDALVAYDVATGERFDVVLGGVLADVRSVTVRPA